MESYLQLLWKAMALPGEVGAVHTFESTIPKLGVKPKKCLYICTGDMNKKFYSSIVSTKRTGNNANVYEKQTG